MKLDYRPDGRIIPILEVGDLVRLVRNEPGPEPTALAGEWGRIVKIKPLGRLDIQLAGFCRPRSVAMALARDIMMINVVPCDAKGLPVRLPTWSETNAALPSRNGNGL
jgi:hypothetical protein